MRRKAIGERRLAIQRFHKITVTESYLERRAGGTQIEIYSLLRHFESVKNSYGHIEIKKLNSP